MAKRIRIGLAAAAVAGLITLGILYFTENSFNWKMVIFVAVIFGTIAALAGEKTFDWIIDYFF